MLAGEGYSGQPCTGDLDGDGISEVVRPSSTFDFVAMELDGTMLWGVNHSNDLGTPGCTIADLDGDGTPEVLLSGGDASIVDGLTGQIRVGPIAIGYGLQWGGPALVDLNGDGSTEVVLGANNYVHQASNHGVLALSSTHRVWTGGAASWPTSSHTAGAFDAMGRPLVPPEWWQSNAPYPGP